MNEPFAAVIGITAAVFAVAIFVFVIIGIVRDEYERFINSKKKGNKK